MCRKRKKTSHFRPTITDFSRKHGIITAFRLSKTSTFTCQWQSTMPPKNTFKQKQEIQRKIWIYNAENLKNIAFSANYYRFLT